MHGSENRATKLCHQCRATRANKPVTYTLTMISSSPLRWMSGTRQPSAG